jgi:serine dehydrogenase proteinase
MALDFSSLLWILFLFMALQPLLMGRWYTVRRAQAIRAIERAHGTRVITMIHRQEKRSLFGFSVSRHIDLEDAQTIIAAIKETPADVPRGGPGCLNRFSASISGASAGVRLPCGRAAG